MKKPSSSHFIVSADTIVYRAGKVYPKTNKIEKIKSYLLELSGRKHTVFGSICIISPDNRVVTRVIKTEVSFKRISNSELNDPDLLNDGIGKAGGYAIQSYGSLFVKNIKGSYSNIVGISLYDVFNILIGLGWKKTNND